MRNLLLLFVCLLFTTTTSFDAWGRGERGRSSTAGTGKKYCSDPNLPGCDGNPLQWELPPVEAAAASTAEGGANSANGVPGSGSGTNAPGWEDHKREDGEDDYARGSECANPNGCVSVGKIPGDARGATVTFPIPP